MLPRHAEIVGAAATAALEEKPEDATNLILALEPSDRARMLDVVRDGLKSRLAEHEKSLHEFPPDRDFEFEGGSYRAYVERQMDELAEGASSFADRVDEQGPAVAEAIRETAAALRALAAAGREADEAHAAAPAPQRSPP